MDVKKSFDLLGLAPEAEKAQAKRAYKAHVRRWHPDQFPEGSVEKAEAEERLKQVNIAYARVKSYLALRRTDPGATANAESPKPQASPDVKTTKGSWFDHLFDTLNAFAGHRGGASTTTPAENSTPRRRRTFEQVLDEMASSGIASKPRRSKGHVGSIARPGTAGYGRRRSGGAGVGAVGSMERPGPVKPVGRVRGIGRSR